MYRIFCESYENYIELFDKECYRLRIAKDFKLLTDENKYAKEKSKQSLQYKKVSDLLNYIQENLDRFPRLKAFLWTIEARGMVPKKFNVANEKNLEEQAKLINSFIKLVYWF